MFARSVMDRVGDRSDRAYAHDFTNTLRTKRIHSLVGLIDKRDIEIADVRIYGHRVLCKVAVQKTAIARVYFTGFAQGRSDSQMMPPYAWLIAVRRLMTRPQSITLT